MLKRSIYFRELTANLEQGKVGELKILIKDLSLAY
jgi:hypothetical protein